MNNANGNFKLITAIGTLSKVASGDDRLSPKMRLEGEEARDHMRNACSSLAISDPAFEDLGLLEL
jgi:hypothetical protein